MQVEAVSRMSRMYCLFIALVAVAASAEARQVPRSSGVLLDYCSFKSSFCMWEPSDRNSWKFGDYGVECLKSDTTLTSQVIPASENGYCLKFTEKKTKTQGLASISLVSEQSHQLLLQTKSLDSSELESQVHAVSFNVNAQNSKIEIKSDKGFILTGVRIQLGKCLY